MLTDHLSGKTGGRSERCTASNTCPKRFEVNTANEYWVKAGSLLHTDTRGKDLKDPRRRALLPDVRPVARGRGHHRQGSVPAVHERRQPLSRPSRAPGRARRMGEQRDRRRPRARCRGTPTNRRRAVPRPGFQTGVVPQAALEWPTIPGVTYNGLITTRYLLDFGPMFDDGILSNYPPSVVGRPVYPIFRVEGGPGRQRSGRRSPAAGRGAGRDHHRLGIAPRRLRRERRL